LSQITSIEEEEEEEEEATSWGEKGLEMGLGKELD